jgi:PilZ domain
MRPVVSNITDDRRMAYRQRSKIPIRYRVRRTSASEHISAAENVSELGIFFRTDQELSIGASVELLVDMPKAINGTSALQWYCRGRVVRIDSPDPLNGLRGIGVQFSCYEILFSEHHLEDWRLSA